MSEEQKKLSIKKGDVVTREEPGGCPMTVEHIDCPGGLDEPSLNDVVHCVWFDGAERVCRQAAYRGSLIPASMRLERNKAVSEPLDRFVPAPENYKLVSRRKVIDAIRCTPNARLPWKAQMALENAIYELPAWSEAEPYVEQDILDHLPSECRECGSYLITPDMPEPPAVKLEIDAFATHYTTELNQPVPGSPAYHNVCIQPAFVSVVCRACLTDHRLHADTLRVGW